MPKVLFVADKFADETRSAAEVHPGGAELTDASAIAACPWPLTKRRFGELDASELDRFDAIVIGNSQRASDQELDALASTRRHVLFEHDVRICLYNGNFPSTGDVLHKSFQHCWCPHLRLRALFGSARGVIFLTSRQRAVYEQNPFFSSPPRDALGCSLFSSSFFDRMESARSNDCDRRGTVVVYSPNAIKGYAQSRRWAEKRALDVREIRAASPDDVLNTLSRCESFVYLPIGLEPAGRLPVEARLLGCDVVVNENVGVAGEPWWHGDRAAGIAWLERAPRRFWRIVEDFLNRRPDPLPPSAANAGVERALERLARATRFTRFAARALPPSPGVLLRRHKTERYARW